MVKTTVVDNNQKVPAGKSKSAGNIYIKGARVHNLKNVDVEIPRNKLVVVLL
jgi:excinuclease ABC subunit A